MILLMPLPATCDVFEINAASAEVYQPEPSNALGVLFINQLPPSCRGIVARRGFQFPRGIFSTRSCSVGASLPVGMEYEGFVFFARDGHEGEKIEIISSTTFCTLTNVHFCFHARVHVTRSCQYGELR